MRICLLTNQDLSADPFPADDWPCDPRPFLPEAHWEVECLTKRTSVAQVTRRIDEGFDVFFNLCDGAADQDIPGIEVVRTLRAAGYTQLPIIMMSAGTAAEPLRQAGAPTVLPKPFMLDEVVSCIERYCGRAWSPPVRPGDTLIRTVGR